MGSLDTTGPQCQGWGKSWVRIPALPLDGCVALGKRNWIPAPISLVGKWRHILRKVEEEENVSEPVGVMCQGSGVPGEGGHQQLRWLTQKPRRGS